MRQALTKRLRAALAKTALAVVLASPLAGVALAQEGVPGTGSVAGEGHGPVAEARECPAVAGEAADEECLDYWENHINWFSWDYKAGPGQALEHRHMPAPFGFAIFNFLVFGAVIYKLAARPLKDFVRTRHTTIRKDLDDAAAIHREAEVRLGLYEQRIAGLDGEIQTLLAQVRTAAEAEKARIIAAAEHQAQRLQIEAQEQIAADLDRVRRELKVEAVNAAVAVAEKLLTEKAGLHDATLTERFISSLETGAPGTMPPSSSTAKPAIKSVATR